MSNRYTQLSVLLLGACGWAVQLNIVGARY